ncbi:glycosyltransferase [uncultured Parasphingorhabdus sp.]|uniref:glycosyltransferase n=1 Tax=uncultured Parasphingorhabdus sp. TaxID=2709694 RepID=UPI0030DC197B|tara:strand:+ start:13554 stop:14732 length:1179 start_codon:yes stop_codon:yes gene_type:complete
MTRPLRILTLSTLFPNAAAPNFGIFVERQTAELAARPATEVTVINPVGIPPWPLSKLGQYQALKALPEHEQWRGLNVYRPRFRLIPKIGGGSNPRRIAEALLPLVSKLHEQHPFDVIDAEFFYPDGPAAMRLATALDIPFTIKARGADIHHWSVDPKCRFQILHAAQKASALLAVSEALKQDMAALGMDGAKISVHYTGLDQDKFRPVDRVAAKQALGVRGPLFITTGALIARKNQDLVIRALTQLPDATLMLAGQGEQEQAYRALAKQLGVADRVRFLGSVPHDQLPHLTAAADIAILVSKSEGLANAWVEALACGTPVIISEAGGARELVTSASAGRVVDQAEEAIVEAAKSILAESPAQELVRSSVSKFSWKSNGDQLQAILRRAAGKS